MTARGRSMSVFCVIGSVLVLTHLASICRCLEWAGLIDAARWIRSEYLTGTAICVILAMLWLFRGDGRCWARGRPCTVCGRALEPTCRYCPHCGSHASRA